MYMEDNKIIKQENQKKMARGGGGSTRKLILDKTEKQLAKKGQGDKEVKVTTGRSAIG